MAYISTVDNGTTIVVTTSEDVVTFTVATADAVLLEATPVCAVIRETYYIYTVYDLRIIRWRHDTGDTTTGMAGADRGGPYQISGELYWIPLTAAEETANAARTTQLQDMVMAAPTTGSEVTDLVIPADLSSDGFAADGARHVEMASEVLAYTADTTRIGHVDVIHDPMITTDGSTDRVIEHIKADDNAASSTIVATIGSNGNWETLENANRNTSNDSISTDIDRGTGLDTVDTYMIDHNVSAYDNAYFNQGTKIISFTPQFSYNDAADQTIWSLYVDAGDYIQITYDAGNDRYELRVSWGGTLATLTGSAYTADGPLQQLTTIMAAWDSDEDVAQLTINGQVVDNATNTGTPSASGAAYAMTGADCVTDADGTGQLPADIYIGDSKAIDGCLLPYGAYYTGPGAVDTALADEDILFYLDFEAGYTDLINSIAYATIDGDVQRTSGAAVWGSYGADANGTGNDVRYDDSDGLDLFPLSGCVSCWFNAQTITNNAGLFCLVEYDATSEYLDCRMIDDTGDFHLLARAVLGGTTETVVTTTGALVTGTWYHLVIRWSNGTSFQIEINGVVEDTQTSVGTSTQTNSRLYLFGDRYGNSGGDYYLDEFYITNNPNTPQIPVILGSGPIYAPIREIS